MNIYKLLWRRYYKPLVVLMVIIFGGFVLQTAIQISDWQQTNTFMHSQVFKDAYAHDLKIVAANQHKTQRQIESENSNGDNQTQFIMGEKELTNPLTTKQYIKRGTAFFVTNSSNNTSYQNLDRIRDNTGFLTANLIPMGFLVLVILMFLLAEDNAQSFNMFLTSTRFKRSQIIRAEMFLLVGVPLATMVLGVAVYFASTYVLIPSEAYNIATQGYALSQAFNTMAWNFLLMIIACLASVIIGLRFGSAILSALFFVSMQLVPQAVVRAKYLGHYDDFNTKGMVELHEFNRFIQSPSVSVGIILIAILLGTLAVITFNHLSLERNDKFVMFARLRWPLWWITLIYTTFVLSLTIANPSPEYAIVIVFWMIVNVGMYYFIFTPQSWRHPFKSIS